MSTHPLFFDAFISNLKKRHHVSPQSQQVMEDIATHLIHQAGANTFRSPIHIGPVFDSVDATVVAEVQSGKTTTYSGVIAKGLDQFFEVVIVLTQKSKPLTDQTVKRLERDLEQPIRSRLLSVSDMMKIDPLQPPTRKQKLIIVVKKEKSNIDRLVQLFTHSPHLLSSKVLIVDDEADAVSVSYRKDKKVQGGIAPGTNAQGLSQLRSIIPASGGVVVFMQVTATPYSLFLQPCDLKLHNLGFQGLRPKHVFVLEPHPQYVGGEIYFERGQDPNHYASHIFIPINQLDLDQLNTKNRSLLSRLMVATEFAAIREALINYVAAASVRELQERADDDECGWPTPYLSSFVVHAHLNKKPHSWQQEIVQGILEGLRHLAMNNRQAFERLIAIAYAGLSISVTKAGEWLPALSEIISFAETTLVNKDFSVNIVNSDSQVTGLLNSDGQLRLSSTLNVFIGGQSLDRGVTIDHLIGFIYGRCPKTFQMDTSLQHARMYGARSKRDVAVTRLYTTPQIYDVLSDIYFLDKQLRLDLKDPQRTIAFIGRDASGQLRPCGPQKTALSKLLTVGPNSRLLPIGFDVKAPSLSKIHLDTIDAWVKTHGIMVNHGQFRNGPRSQWTATLKEVEKIFACIAKTYDFSSSPYPEWDIDLHLEILKRAADRGKVRVHYATSLIQQKKSCGQRFQDAPDDGRKTRPHAAQDASAYDCPVIMLIHVGGSAQHGWSGIPFYWPVIMTQPSMDTLVYTED